MTKRRAEPQIILTEGSIRVRWANRVVTILPAPPQPNTREPADFVVDMDSILYWDAPNETIEISVEELQTITQAIEAEFERIGLVVEFE
jgi:hypothetical protein